MFFYYLYFVCIAAPILLTWTFLTAVFTIIVSMLGFGRWAGYYPEVLWARLFCILSLVRVKVHGRENIDPKRGYIFAANHQGAYDIFSVYGYLGHNFRWMMKASLEKIPFVGYACRSSKQIFVDRHNPKRMQRSMADAEAQLAGGMSIVIFPEGSRTHDGNMQRFKRGAFKLAEEFSLPVVPLSIAGSYNVMSRNAKAPRPGVITLTIHRPIEATGDKHDIDHLMQATFDAIATEARP